MSSDLRDNRLTKKATSLLSALTLAVSSSAGQDVTLAWDRATSHGPDITFDLLWGRVTGAYTERGDAGTNLTYTVRGLTPGVTNYFAVIAKTPDGVMSDPSNEVQYALPLTAPLLSIERTLLSTVVLTVKGSQGEQVAIEASEYPTGPTWVTVFEGTIPESGELSFIEASNLASRFYRAKSLALRQSGSR